jgi:acetylornithine/succinyldiaminopimelate/putrescine aminotransferase/predicted amino acid dehydrogenase/acyl-coenzyme A synthetase/AMP-(fatty) acid ligase
MDNKFDLIFESHIKNIPHSGKTIGHILFDNLPGRDIGSKIILSHYENQYVELTLGHIRKIVRNLVSHFEEKKILPGETVILLTFGGCNEMITAIFILALAARGCRIFLPMFSENKEFEEWIKLTGTKHIILPGIELEGMDGHDKGKSDILKIKSIASILNIEIWDSTADFGIYNSILGINENISCEDSEFRVELNAISSEDEVLIITTSGTSGKSKLVVYSHEAYYMNCLAWEQAGFYKKKSLGGTGFTPLITHTMGIRALINALWTGSPVCLIITEWFLTKPETVRYLLLKMNLEHITGGPAVYKTFLELFRIYPELKSAISKNLKTLISSGAPYDTATADEIFNATGLFLHNAYGTTETQQVFSTVLSYPSSFNKDKIPLGHPLPGVSVGLIRTEDEHGHYRLYVKSAFSHKLYISPEGIFHNDFFDTGDIVYLDENKCFFYVRRASLDFFKDSFGVKIPVISVREYYKNLDAVSEYIEYYPITNFPGLAALIFIKEKSLTSGLVKENRVLKKYAGFVEEINNRLSENIESFEFQHRHVRRIALVNQMPPLTGKGTISVKQINIQYFDTIGRLTDARKDGSGIESIDMVTRMSEKYTRYLSPQIGDLMSSLKINYRYHRGSGDSLFTFIHGEEFEIMDVTGGYGTNLLGHSNPLITKTVVDFISSGKISICNQLSIQNYAGLLAEKLNLLIGLKTGKSYNVVLGNSGSEAVEIAIHHALFEWEKRIGKMRDQQFQMYGCSNIFDIKEIWAKNLSVIKGSKVRVITATNSFHGHTTGARNLLGNYKKRTKFSNLHNIEAIFIDDRKENWHELLSATLNDSFITLERISQTGGELKVIPFRLQSVIAAIVEPVLGEGGVRVINNQFLNELSMEEFPLISDEIQCGLGRTGYIPECKCAHYYLFGKALGGGVEKISAVMIESARYCYNFNEYYSSTFANGELAAVTAMKTLDIINSESFLATIRQTGSYLAEKLSDLHRNHPSVIKEIHGKGLMQAITFNPECASDNIFLRALFKTEKVGFLFSGWLLNNHRIRMFPALSSPYTLRIEPSAYFMKDDTNRLVLALDDLCSVIKEKQMYKLFSYLMDNDHFVESFGELHINNFLQQHYDFPSVNSVKTAVIVHFAYPLKDLRIIEPDFKKASDTGLRILYNRLQTLMDMEPVKLLSLNLFHGKVHFSMYLIPLDSSELEFLHKSGKRKKIISKIQNAVNMAIDEGAEVISLGGYTSILTNNGLSLYEPQGKKIITGNTLTAASGMSHLINKIKSSHEFNKTNIVAVVGSTGNIGQVIAEILCIRQDICSELILVSRSEKRVTELIQDINKKYKNHVRVRGTCSLTDIKDADVIVISTNTNDPIIFPHSISSEKPVLISDLSIPSAISQDVGKMQNVTSLAFSAFVSLSEDKDVVISSFSPPGTLFCCAAEAILLGLEKFEKPLKGKINPEAVMEMTLLAEKHNFLQTTGSLESFKTGKT